MPIHLITGKGGSGKTLYTLSFVIDYIEKERKQREEQGLEPRPVFYHGIPDLKLPWFKLEDPLKWFECPTGSIIIIDEIQLHMPNRPNGSKDPEYSQRFTTARHHGFDVFALSQDPSFVDPILRKMANVHFHVLRKFGGEAANVYEWNTVKTSPEAKEHKKSAVLHKFKYPKNIYPLYKSADLHTVKVRRPMQVYFIWALPFILGGLIWLAYMYLTKATGQEKAPQQSSSPAPGQTAPHTTGDGKPQMTREQWIETFQPRLAGLAYTAPRYDDVTKPTKAPFPDACIQSEKRGCKCYTKQATVLDVSKELCMQIVERGFYRDFDDPENSRIQPAMVPTSATAAPSTSSTPPEPLGMMGGKTPKSLDPRYGTYTTDKDGAASWSAATRQGDASTVGRNTALALNK